MKIIEALKQQKFLLKKADDIRSKMTIQCADMSFDTPQFPDMKAKVAEWTQAHTDVLRECARLKFRIQKTNVMTNLTINLNGNEVTKTLYEWIQRRKEFAHLELKGWECLSDRGLSDRKFTQTDGQLSEVKMRRYYDPVEKASKVDQLKFEPVAIDAALEIANCTIDLME